MRNLIIITAFNILLSTTVFAQENRISSKGFAVASKGAEFETFEFSRHAVGENDVLIDILYSSICHSDLHQTRDDWRPGIYPMVPGHEMVGVVSKVGSKVTKFKVGDYAGVGTMINSTDETEAYKEKNGGYWNPAKTIWTYNSHDHVHDEPTRGGYANNIVVNQNFALKVPKNADLKKVAPLFCAGITVYSPIQFSEVKKGQKVAVAGFGGLGNMAVKFLQHIGADITVIDVNESKREIAKKMGLKYIDGNNQAELAKARGSFDFLLSTVPTSYDPFSYLDLVKVKGQMAVVGQPAADANASISMTAFPFHQHKFIYGSVIGSLEMEQRMINFCVENNIYPDVEIIEPNAKAITNVYKLLDKHEAQFRYVIDMTKLK
ncbi:MAG: NAD(P)-dependent alcohol dehydrogenase [Breznakibacter sp.]